MKIKDIVIDDNGRIYNLRDELTEEQQARYDKALAILNQHVTTVDINHEDTNIRIISTAEEHAPKDH
jgi:hypothetical protein